MEGGVEGSVTLARGGNVTSVRGVREGKGTGSRGIGCGGVPHVASLLVPSCPVLSGNASRLGSGQTNVSRVSSVSAVTSHGYAY